MEATRIEAVVVRHVWLDDVEVVRLDDRADLAGSACYALPVWYRPGTRAPRLGERVTTWADVIHRYVLAPRTA